MSRDPIEAILATGCTFCGVLPGGRCLGLPNDGAGTGFHASRIRAAHKREELDPSTVEACARKAQDELSGLHDSGKQRVVYDIVRRIRALANPKGETP